MRNPAGGFLQTPPASFPLTISHWALTGSLINLSHPCTICHILCVLLANLQAQARTGGPPTKCHRVFLRGQTWNWIHNFYPHPIVQNPVTGSDPSNSKWGWQSQSSPGDSVTWTVCHTDLSLLISIRHGFPSLELIILFFRVYFDAEFNLMQLELQIFLLISLYYIIL